MPHSGWLEVRQWKWCEVVCVAELKEPSNGWEICRSGGRCETLCKVFKNGLVHGCDPQSSCVRTRRLKTLAGILVICTCGSIERKESCYCKTVRPQRCSGDRECVMVSIRTYSKRHRRIGSGAGVPSQVVVTFGTWAHGYMCSLYHILFTMIMNMYTCTVHVYIPCTVHVYIVTIIWMIWYHFRAFSLQEL